MPKKIEVGKRYNNITKKYKKIFNDCSSRRIKMDEIKQIEIKEKVRIYSILVKHKSINPMVLYYTGLNEYGKEKLYACLVPK